MFWFHTTYVRNRLVVMDVTEVRVGRKRVVYVAALSADPRVSVQAARADLALARLEATIRAWQSSQSFWRPTDVTMMTPSAPLSPIAGP